MQFPLESERQYKLTSYELATYTIYRVVICPLIVMYNVITTYCTTKRYQLLPAHAALSTIITACGHLTVCTHIMCAIAVDASGGCFGLGPHPRLEPVSYHEIKHLPRTEQVCWPKNVLIRLCAIISHCTLPQFSLKLVSCSVYTWSGEGVSCNGMCAPYEGTPLFSTMETFTRAPVPSAPWFLHH